MGISVFFSIGGKETGWTLINASESSLNRKKTLYARKYDPYMHTVKPAHAITSIKQSPVLKGHIFFVLS